MKPYREAFDTGEQVRFLIYPYGPGLLQSKTSHGNGRACIGPDEGADGFDAPLP